MPGNSLPDDQPHVYRKTRCVDPHRLAPYPAGGFDWPSVAHWLHAWRAYKGKQITALALRLFCGLCEAKHRRSPYWLPPGTPVHYHIREQQRLLGNVRRSQAEDALESLSEANIMRVTEDSIQFLTKPEVLPDSADRLHRPFLHRRMLPYLAGEGSPGLIAVTCCVAMRCLQYHPGIKMCEFGGTVDAEWIARHTQLAERTVYKHLDMLEALRFQTTERRPRWYERRYGPWRSINQAWEAPKHTATPTARRTRPQPGCTEETTSAAARRRERVVVDRAVDPPPVDQAATEGPEGGGKKSAVSTPSPCKKSAVSTSSSPSNGVEFQALFYPSLREETYKHQNLAPDAPTAGVKLTPDALTPSTSASGVYGGEEKGEKPPDPPNTAEAFAAMYQTLPADRQAARQAEALASLLQQGYKQDFITTPLILYEVCRLLALQESCSVDPVPAASSAGVAPSPVTVPARATPPPAVRPPTRSHTPCKAVGEARTAKARLPAPTLYHLLPEDLLETARLLVLYDQARRRELIGTRDPDRLTFVAMAAHARRVGEDNPCGLFATLLHNEDLRRHITDADDEAARGRLKQYDHGIDPRRRAHPPPAASAMPDLSEDARRVRAVQDQWERLGYCGDGFAYANACDPAWTRERWDNAVAELEAAKLLWKQGHTLNRLGDLGTARDCLPALDSAAGEHCAECGEEREACMCPAADDTA